MMTQRSTTLAVLLAGALSAWSGAVAADVASDRAAAILIFPRVLAPIIAQSPAGTTVIIETDTLIQISNTTTEPVTLHCFYVDATSRCSASGVACDENFEPGCPLEVDLCLPAWTETDFQINLTPRQPLAWRASAGLPRELFPLDGVRFRGPRGESNAGSAIPPVARKSVLPIDVPDVAVDLFAGELKCIVVDPSGRGIANNAIKGEASIVTSTNVAQVSSGQQQFAIIEKYNAIGIQAIDGDANDDGVLELGGEAGEYNGCPNVLIVNHFFDTDLAFAGLSSPLDGLEIGPVAPLQEPIGRFSELTLVPCSQNLRSQVGGTTVAQFLVFNEFEQRFSTSRTVDCYFRRLLSLIDTTQPDRSIFSIGVAGTAAGQTRVRGVTGGLLGVLSEALQAIVSPPFGLDNAANLHHQGDRAEADRIVLP